MPPIRIVGPRPGDPDPLPPLPASLEGMIRIVGDQPAAASADPGAPRSTALPGYGQPPPVVGQGHRDATVPRRRLRLLLALLLGVIALQAVTMLLIASLLLGGGRTPGQSAGPDAAAGSTVRPTPSPALVIQPAVSVATQGRVSVSLLHVVGAHVGIALNLRTGQSVGFALTSSAPSIQHGGFDVGQFGAPGILSVLPGDQVAVTTVPYTEISVLQVEAPAVTSHGR